MKEIKLMSRSLNKEWENAEIYSVFKFNTPFSSFIKILFIFHPNIQIETLEMEWREIKLHAYAVLNITDTPENRCGTMHLLDRCCNV